jgi:hypothetical protein
MSRDCWEEGGRKHGQAPKSWKPRGKKNKSDSKNSNASKDSKSPQANTATTSNNEPDGVWLAEDAAYDNAEATTTLSYATLAQGSTSSVNATTELYDSGASLHLSPFCDHFVTFTNIPPKPITAADKGVFHAVGQGDLYVEIPNGNSKSRILLKNVLYAPSMGVTLVSISKLAAAGYAALFRDSVCHIFDPKKKLLGEVIVSNGLYRVRNGTARQPFAGAASTVETLTMENLHAHLSHIAPATIREMLAKGMVEGVRLDPAHETMGQCVSCEVAKATRKPIGQIREPQHRRKFGDEVHTDVWGPSSVQTPGHKTYYASFTDDHTRYMTITLLAAKSDTFEAYRNYEAWAKTQHDTAIKCLRSDRGGEYLSDEFSRHLKAARTERKLTMHDTPQSNGIAEHLNRTLMERIRAMGHESGLPQNLWGEALAHVVWVKN